MAGKNSLLKFVSMGIDAFAGIGKKTKAKIIYPKDVDLTKDIKAMGPEDGLVLVFPEGYPYIEIGGDQGVGKTSFLECLKEAVGGDSSKATEHQSIEPVDGGGEQVITDKKYGNRFYGNDGKLYGWKVTKATATLTQIKTGEDGKPELNAKNKEVTMVMGTPKSTLQELIGPAGISPMKLKALNGADQLIWMRTMMPVDVEADRIENEIIGKLNKAVKDRANANRSYNEADLLLKNDPYFKEEAKWADYFTANTLDKLKAVVADVQTRKTNYDKAVEGLPTLKTQSETLVKDIDFDKEQIRLLQERLKKKEEDLTALNERIANGEKYVSDNKGVVTEYDNMKEKIEEADTFLAKKQSYDNMIAAKAKVNQLQDESVRITRYADETLLLKKEFVKKLTPEIEGLEVCIPDEVDSRQGLFYNKKPLSIISESELWQLATEIWKKFGVKVIFVDNINSLGTDSVKKFNEFINSGGAYIFGTKMDRGEDNLRISFHKQIPLTDEDEE